MLVSCSPIKNGWLSDSRYALRDLFDLERRVVVTDDDELVSSDSRHGVAWSDRSGDPAGHMTKQLICKRVTQRIIDHLEVIDVEEHHAELVPRRCEPASPWAKRSRATPGSEDR